jgi:hypothetical protein
MYGTVVCRATGPQHRVQYVITDVESRRSRPARQEFLVAATNVKALILFTVFPQHRGITRRSRRWLDALTRRP